MASDGLQWLMVVRMANDGYQLADHRHMVVADGSLGKSDSHD